MAGEHLVEDHAERPEVDVLVDVAVLEPLRRRVGRRAPVVGRDLRRLGQRFGDAEVEDLEVAGRADEQVPGLEVGVHQPVVGLAFDRGGEAVRTIEELADADGVSRGETRARPGRL